MRVRFGGPGRAEPGGPLGVTGQAGIVFLLGKPVREDSMFAEILALLRESAEVSVHLPHEVEEPVAAWLPEARLVVHRGLKSSALASLLEVERAGVRCCNSVAATISTRDRMLMLRTLADAGVPVPGSAQVATWRGALEAAGGRPAVLKAVTGKGRGSQVILAAEGDLPEAAPFDGPYVVQEYIPNDGLDRKVYVAGPSASGLLKRCPPLWPEGGLVEAFAPEGELLELAHRAGAVLGLEVYGVDFLEGPDGPVVIDVNAFPGFRGVEGAARSLARHLAAVAANTD